MTFQRPSLVKIVFDVYSDWSKENIKIPLKMHLTTQLHIFYFTQKKHHSAEDAKSRCGFRANQFKIFWGWILESYQGHNHHNISGICTLTFSQVLLFFFFFCWWMWYFIPVKCFQIRILSKIHLWVCRLSSFLKPRVSFTVPTVKPTEASRLVSLGQSLN